MYRKTHIFIQEQNKDINHINKRRDKLMLIQKMVRYKITTNITF